MIGWLFDALTISMGSGVPPAPRTAEEASERFVLRLLAVMLGLGLTAAGALTAWLAGPSLLRQVGFAALVVGGLLVLTGIPRLLQLWRAAKVLRRANGAKH